MKKFMNTLFVLAIAAMTFSSCEDVPAPYNMPQEVLDDESGTSSSAEATGSGTADDPYNVAAANEETAKLSSGESLGSTVYIKGIVSQIVEVDPSYGNATYYISDDGTTTDQYYVYRGYSLGNVKFTSEDEIKVGDEVIICGELYNYYGTYELTQGNYIYSLNGVTAGGSSTSEASGSGTATDPYNVAAANELAASLSSGESTGSSVYVKGIISQINEVDTSYGNATYYISDDGTTDNQFYVYRGYSLGNVKFTSESEIKVGDEVIIYGEIYNYYNTYEFTQGNYIYSLNGATEGSSTSAGAGTLDSPYSVTEALNIINAGTYTSDEVYVKGIISQIDQVSTSYGNATYYISDDGTTTNQLEIYRGYSLNGDKFTSEDEIQVGDEVVVLGVLTLYYSTPEITTGSQIVSINSSSSSSSEGSATISKSGTTITMSDGSATASSSTATCDLSTYGWENATEPTTVTLDDGTTISFAQEGGNNAPKYYTATNGVRMYALNSMTIVGSKKIAKIVLTCDSYNGTDYTGNDALYTTISGNTWTMVNDYSGNSGGTQVRVQVIEITYAE